MENIETLLAAVAQTQGFDDDEPVASTAPELGLPNSDCSPETRGDTGGLQLTVDAAGYGRPSAVVDTPPPAPTPAYVAIDKRKRGRPPRGQLVTKPPPPKRVKPVDEEEDVCFICFDGGSLVLCDRKGCPKAYHPACIKRDEAFFQSAAKWNCGWHICSVCRKSSHYLCYTCTYSLCKRCTKDADYLCVRENKGFCSTCMKTIMMIENKEQAMSVKVDFDDKTSWEYLFKMYWVYVKQKLSLTLSELTQAQKPWKGVASVAYKPQLSDVEIRLLQNDVKRTTRSSIGNHVVKQNSVKEEVGSCHHKDNVKPCVDEVTDKATEEPLIKVATEEPHIKAAIEEPHIKTVTEELLIEKDRNDLSLAKDTLKPCIRDNKIDRESKREIEWATKELLEFVAHMQNGDTSAISQFDVQKLLLDYIKRNNLRDPRRKSEIICDLRLTNLFGKPRVGHIEMLKLLEFHFLIKKDSHNSSFIPAGSVSSIASDVEADGNIYGSPMQINSRKRKTRKKIEERILQNNLNDYAAIDVHNINLVYLRRNLMEHLMDDRENFNTKVNGAIVRIKISSNDQKQDVHRLVQVVGTSKVAEPYKIGDRTTDVILEVLNLDKKEVVSIDAISNQEFTEDECRRLRQSIRCGLVKQFTVGEVQQKAMALQRVRVNDWLEAEILRLSSLRDRASEKGRKKELREYVDKLQLLNSPEERQRRISEVPEIHSDPKMNPNYESEEDTRICDSINKDEYARPSYPGLSKSGRKHISPNKKGKEKQPIPKPNSSITNSASEGKNGEAMQKSGLETCVATCSSVGNSPPANHIETEKLWHYRDPNGKIQGPFSMMQLRKWNASGLFPPDMRIWTNHEQYDSLLLSDALNGKLHGPLESSSCKPCLGPHRNGVVEVSEDIHVTVRDSKPTESISGVVTTDESSSSHWPRCWDLLKDSNSSGDGVQESGEFNHGSQNGEKKSTEVAQNPRSSVFETNNNNDDRAVSSEENSRSLKVDLSSVHMESVSVFALDSSRQRKDVDVLDLLPSPTPKTAAENPVLQNCGILELLSLAPRSNDEDETKQSGCIKSPTNGGSNIGVADEWCGYSPTPGKTDLQEWDSGLVSVSSTRPPEVTSENIDSPIIDVSQSFPASNLPSWLQIFNEPIEFDALGEESVSDLLAEVDAMELQGTLHSPTSAMKFARELIEDCKDDCFSSIEQFSSTPDHNPRKSDALSSTGEVQLNSQSSPTPMETSFKRSSEHSSASNEGETSNNAGQSNANQETRSDNMDPSWGTVQGNINLVTVQGNVNLVLGGGPSPGMGNLGWGTNPGSPWVNHPNMNLSPINVGQSWDGGHRKYGGERFNSPREWGCYQGGDSGFGRGRPPWGRQPYGGGGYSRPPPKGQRVCIYYESGHCKKGAFCDYLHP
ncbi:hypothetical protein ABFS82_08G237600 [Erythranthe guttata]|uniref:zinc finger CCCH domain-containing protein 44-like n=1 Tax=Erythranthe guttata TaxID=4155 RepID=UPI00064D8F5B|nr:PREDICTED: zinc finger CCCH domain-containing protein 44-like [Erythranthe guttata]|eukprot:XP_012845228.1 PREDICTED: zinc finger CCCH domain-containing protein 44-like [Erythranthe guttata]